MRQHAVLGYCGTNRTADVAAKGASCVSTHGRWYTSGTKPSLQECARRCTACDSCRFVSFSAHTVDCSLYAACDVSHLTRVHGYTTLDVRQLSASDLLESPSPPISPRAEASWSAGLARLPTATGYRSPGAMLSVLILGGSVTGGGGVGNRVELAWHNSLANVRMTVHHKNAIDPSYFLHCTGRFVSRSYDVVLVDLGANMFGGRADRALAEVIHRVRCLSNATSVGLVNWPGPFNVNGHATRSAAALSKAEVIDVPHSSDLYSDGAHPNARGHALIAQSVQLYLANRSLFWPGSRSCETPGTRSETCYPNAVDLPVTRSSSEPLGWRLDDDSPTPNLMHKYGWASAERGVNITFALPPLSVCGSVVTLAFLTSNTTGDFRLTCSSGCQCSPIRHYWQKQIYPFPVVLGQKNCDSGGRNCDGLKVTYETSFNMLREKDGECRVTATTLTKQRVRIDGLYAETPSEEIAEYLNKSARASADQRRFGQHAHSRQCSQLPAR